MKHVHNGLWMGLPYKWLFFENEPFLCVFYKQLNISEIKLVFWELLTA